MSPTIDTPKEKTGDFYHVVYFWLKNPASAEDRRTFESSLSRFLNASEFISTKHVGVPAETVRPVIDRSYTYSLIVSFVDKAAQDAYQNEDVHKAFIKECEPLWQKVVVYDSENILK
ncbi:MAG TPA: Dabb family protein [Saprospiraceae bacterium]|nr:Dabb family protein [Saprospiraceae bacterium]